MVCFPSWNAPSHTLQIGVPPFFDPCALRSNALQEQDIFFRIASAAGSNVVLNYLPVHHPTARLNLNLIASPKGMWSCTCRSDSHLVSFREGFWKHRTSSSIRLLSLCPYKNRNIVSPAYLYHCGWNLFC